MKKLLLTVLLLLMLIGCEDVVEEVSYELDVLSVENTLESVIEESEYLVHDDMLPNYVPLLLYSDEVLIDWDTSTERVCVETDVFNFEFETQEYISAVELITENINIIKLTFSNDATKTIHLEPEQTVVEFDDYILSHNLTVEIVSTGQHSASIREFHIIGELKVDQVAYTAHQEQDTFIKDMLTVHKWQKNVQSNIDVAKMVNEQYGEHTLRNFAKIANLKRLSLNYEKFIGYPINLNGKIVDVIEEDGLYKLIVDTHIFGQNIIVYSEEPYEKNKHLVMSGIFLGIDELLIFYGIK